MDKIGSMLECPSCRNQCLLAFSVVATGLLILSGGAVAVKIVDLKIPTYIRHGEKTEMHCEFRLQGDEKLYSVKWYKDELEFFRFLPSKAPQKHPFSDINGVQVDIASSTASKVVLKPVTQGSSGFYRCEVLGEAPNFSTDTKTKQMEVVELPDEDPLITGLRGTYRLGDEVAANCTVGLSRPAANIKWLVNGRPVRRTIDIVPTLNGRGLLTAGLGLRLPLGKSMFRLAENASNADMRRAIGESAIIRTIVPEPMRKDYRKSGTDNDPHQRRYSMDSAVQGSFWFEQSPTSNDHRRLARKSVSANADSSSLAVVDLTCVAEIANLYHRSVTRRLLLEDPATMSRRYFSSLASSSGVTSSSAILAIGLSALAQITVRTFQLHFQCGTSHR